MRKICVINQKGGVGKTTTTVNIAKGLADLGNKVLIIDFDPQGNVSDCLNVPAGPDIYNFLIERTPLQDCTRILEDNLHVMPSKETLTKAELILAGEQAREMFLKRMLEKLDGYDYVFIDCPPSLSLLNQNALLYADEAIIPTSTDALGVDALHKMIQAVETINDVFGHDLKISAIIPTLHDARLKSCRECLDQMQSVYYDMITPPVRVNSKLKEAPRKHQTIFEYDKRSRGANDYRAVVDYLVNHHGIEITGVQAIAQRA